MSDRPTMRYYDLSAKTRTMLDMIISAWFERRGWPANMTHEEAAAGMINLLENGGAKIIIEPSETGSTALNMARFRIELTAEGKVLAERLR